MSPKTFPIKRPHQLPELPEDQQWLVEGLWSHQAVGVIGGEPKCCKSFLALGMAVAVASGRDCLGRYRVAHTGTVLVFAAEDALHVVRERLQWICADQGLVFEDLDVWIITAPRIRLDHGGHRELLDHTVATVKPKLLVLDPFVRLHSVDENLSAAVVPLLAFLRELQRRYGCAVALVHHARKGGSTMRAGQALRGSSELHAWGDSNLYVRRSKDRLWLTAEHRAQASVTGIPLELQVKDDRFVLIAGDVQPSTPADRERPSKVTDHDRTIEALRAFDHPIRIRQLRAACGMRSATLSRVLHDLCTSGRVTRSEQGWMLVGRFPRDVSS